MNAAVVESFAKGPRFGSFADPAAGAGELLVTVEAAGLHPVVKALANGTHYGSTGKLPFVPGVDGAGRLEDGTRLYFGATRPPFGTFAERSVTNEALSVRLPDGLDSLTAAGIANPGMSSWVALTARAKFVSGESVLILGATGAAGQLAIQIAKRLGARRVVAAGRNPDALKAARELGADAAISLDQSREDVVAAFRSEIVEHGVDVMLDYLWGEPAEALLAAIAQKGLSHAAPRIRFVQIGQSAGATITLPAATLRSSGVELLGSGFGSASMQEIFAALKIFFAQAAAKPFVTKIKAAPLRDVEALWNAPEGVRLVFQP
ncbi:MAG TPA: zinc-binding alcohol dehydrogenase family protein [Acidobacteriaceae bacterium]